MPTPSRDPSQGVGLAARVILHLAGLKHLGPNDIAGLAYTQPGMVAGLGVRQSSLVKVLFNLMAAGVVTMERRFVGEANRRMKVYELTPFGESAARDLRRVTEHQPSDTTGGDWSPGSTPKGGIP
jgi:DNA-binding MarR family transcriptional regulator